jgi:hypothetical protein
MKKIVSTLTVRGKNRILQLSFLDELEIWLMHLVSLCKIRRFGAIDTPYWMLSGDEQIDDDSWTSKHHAPLTRTNSGRQLTLLRYWDPRLTICENNEPNEKNALSSRAVKENFSGVAKPENSSVTLSLPKVSSATANTDSWWWDEPLEHKTRHPGFQSVFRLSQTSFTVSENARLSWTSRELDDDRDGIDDWWSPRWLRMHGDHSPELEFLAIKTCETFSALCDNLRTLFWFDRRWDHGRWNFELLMLLHCLQRNSVQRRGEQTCRRRSRTLLLADRQFETWKRFNISRILPCAWTEAFWWSLTIYVNCRWAPTSCIPASTWWWNWMTISLTTWWKDDTMKSYCSREKHPTSFLDTKVKRKMAMGQNGWIWIFFTVE